MTDSNVSNSGNENSRNSNPTSLSLLARIREKEQEAWTSLVKLYAPLIYSRCRRRFDLAEQDAENVGQEVFGAIHRKVGDFERQRTGSFRAWVNRIVDNKCLDFLRKKNPAQPVGGSEAIDIIRNIPLTDIPEDSVEENDERKTLLREALKQIENEFSSRDLRIFWEVAAEERNKKTVAEEMGVPINVVYLVTSRIRKRLKELCFDLIEDSDFGSELENGEDEPDTE